MSNEEGRADDVEPILNGSSQVGLGQEDEDQNQHEENQRISEEALAAERLAAGALAARSRPRSAYGGGRTMQRLRTPLHSSEGRVPGAPRREPRDSQSGYRTAAGRVFDDQSYEEECEEFRVRPGRGRGQQDFVSSQKRRPPPQSGRGRGGRDRFDEGYQHSSGVNRRQSSFAENAPSYMQPPSATMGYESQYEARGFYASTPWTVRGREMTNDEWYDEPADTANGSRGSDGEYYESNECDEELPAATA